MSTIKNKNKINHFNQHITIQITVQRLIGFQGVMRFHLSHEPAKNKIHAIAWIFLWLKPCRQANYPIR